MVMMTAAALTLVGSLDADDARTVCACMRSQHI